MGSRKVHQIRLTTALCIIFCITVVIVNMAFSSVIGKQAEGILLNQTNEKLFRTVNEALQNLEDMFARYGQSLNLIASNIRITTYLKYYHSLPQVTRLMMEQNISSYIEVATAINPNILDVLVVNDKAFLNKKKREDIVANYNHVQQTWYQELVEQKIVGIWLLKLDFYRNSPLIGMDAVAIGCPVFSYDRKCVGAVLFFLKLEDMQKQIINNKALEHGESYHIVSHKGEIITSFGASGDEDFSCVMNDSRYYMPDELKALPLKQLLMQNDLWVKSAMLQNHLSIVGHVSLEKTHETFHSFHMRNILFVFIITIGICCLFIILFSVLFKKSLQKYLNYLYEIERSNSVSEDTIKKTVFYEANDLALHFHQLVNNLKKLTNENYEYELAHNRIRLEMLLSQINPHFLFNALQFLQSEIMYGDRVKANRFLMSLSRLFRFSMDTKDSLSTVEQEIGFTQNYLELYQNCYENQLDILICVDEELYPLTVPKFLLQPIVENSIKHGFGMVPHQGRIQIQGKKIDGNICFIVEDNGHGLSSRNLEKLRNSLSRKSSENEGRIGLVNIMQRLQIMFGDSLAFQVESEENVFFRVTISFPDSYTDIR